MSKKERFLAATILKSVLQQQTPLSYAFQHDTPPLTKEICFGVLRHYLRLETLALTLLKKKPKDFDVWLTLLIGLYQLAYLSMPEYAVVHETVAILDAFKKIWAKGLVNAVLRRYCREQEVLQQQLMHHPVFQHGHPDWLIQQLKQDWPKYWQNILEANDERAPMSLRVNTRHTTITQYLSRLQTNHQTASLHPFSPAGIVLADPCAVHELPGFSDGDVSVQDCAAQLAVPLLDLKPGQRVLDACCAPGGKTAHMLEYEPHLGTCVALDIDAKRLERVQENLCRLKLSASLKQGNASHPATWWDGVLFDRILLDAPCSATGVIRRHPDIKLLRTAEAIQEIAALQEQILEALWPLLAPNGRLVYATCSIMPAENEHQIAKFASKHPDCMIENTLKPWGHWTGHGWQILPGEYHMDGFYYSVMLKSQ